MKKIVLLIIPVVSCFDVLQKLTLISHFLMCKTKLQISFTIWIFHDKRLNPTAATVCIAMTLLRKTKNSLSMFNFCKSHGHQRWKFSLLTESRNNYFSNTSAHQPPIFPYCSYQEMECHVHACLFHFVHRILSMGFL